MFKVGDKIHVHKSIYSNGSLNGKIASIEQGCIFAIQARFENGMSEYFTIDGRRSRDCPVELRHGHFQKGSKENLLTTRELKRILKIFKAIGTDRNLQMKIEGELVRLGE